MDLEDELGESTTLSADAAFAALGNETRLQILHALGEVGEPLSFSELRARVEMRDSGQFQYHLNKLAGHFIRKTDEGYALRQAGTRVIEAVLSGVITDDPVLEPTDIDFACRLCGASTRLSFRQERVELYCTECSGHYGRGVKHRESRFHEEHGFLGGFHLPPAGIQHRTPMEILQAASTWGHLEFLALANDVCPRCSAVVDHSIEVCEDHDATDGLCGACDKRHAVQITNRCRNCGFTAEGMLLNHLFGNPELRAFVTAQGIDPVVEGVKWGWDYEEEVRSVEPFEARFALTIGDETFTLTVDDDLSVVDAERSQVSESG